ncbi:MAG TPA: DUF4013 domain-containing protein [Candidatus Dormibacteraeota bacterium]|nr:DUF4013 domain-containing protein [Candidatus Dormibacteraeota bacterium]
MNLVAASFAWPFRGGWQSRWAIGVVTVLLLPIGFIPLLGYAISATRSASLDPKPGPPPWVLSGRLLADGIWTSLAVLLLTAPFVLALKPLSALVERAHLWNVGDQALSHFYANIAAGFLLALPWGFVLLLLMPHATVRFATTGKVRDLFDFPAAVRGVGSDFATWNLAAAAIVTAWALGLACLGLLCVGVLPGIFYAILVSAHACAALHPQAANPPAG